MKYLLFCWVFIFFSCTKINRSNKPDTTTKIFLETNIIKVPDNLRYYASSDHVAVHLWKGDSLVYTKEEFNNIIDNYPELISKYTYHPDITYDGLRGKGLRFSSEVGQDEYYELYAYFLKQKNGDSIFSKRRSTLLLIYSKINELFRIIQGGGTYFGHQVSRIEGYVEYDICVHKWRKTEKYQDGKKIYKQKALFIQFLRELVIENNLARTDIPKQYKTKRLKEMNNIVDDITNNITDLFYLRNAQNFLFTHYNYVY